MRAFLPGNVARCDMPQVKSPLVSAFIAELRQRGITCEEVMPRAASLRASQRELHEQNIQALLDKSESLDKPILVSVDGFVLDGHHRWAANARLNRAQRCIQIGLDAAAALAAMTAFAAAHPSECAAKV